ncbi:tripartite tricarboxylate transporter permease [Carboxydochorda subterranea]|uniref:Tripartite tricarboxylate transporter permease n=1 Tax=Carboxydichorda subterranea TaxID=3109565 RepID=A0ABZ1BXC6_9FIRM|nr:tripartite tricarboxylate transporter permease [Limnochorda sp. L945t]WRP17339.1 tripartite tricarboxylate transporter permease [Limnochorda sp. L945t]
MDVLSMLGHGFSVALQPINLLLVSLGVIAGTVVGVLPGIGPISAVALLIPMTFKLPAVSAIIAMAGVYYGAMYGGSTTSILLKTPGEASSVVTTFDGYELARQGRAGSALGVAAIGSFIAGTLGVVLMMVGGPPLGRLALAFQPPEYFALMLLGLTATASFAEGSVAKALISMLVGLALGTIGIDLQTGTTRFTFGNPELLDGVEFLVVALGLFAIAEVLWEVVQPETLAQRIPVKTPYPTREDLRQSWRPMLRGGLIGFLLGVLPGVGASTSSFIVYSIEKQVSKHPERFGRGAIEGVAAPESANNGAASGAMVPLLTLGLPGSATTAVMLGALMIHGIQPGPLLIPQHPEIFWGLVASMYIGNVMLLILNLPLVPLFARILDIPKPLLLAAVVALSFIGVYAINNSLLDLLMLIAFGVLGFVMRVYRFPAAPMVLAIVLGPLMEQTMRQAMMMSRGNPSIFFTRPLSLVVLVLSALLLLVPMMRRRRAPASLPSGTPA